MTVKIFLTGATGYIGGTALDCLVRAHPDYEYTLLVGDERRAATLRDRYPDARLAFAIGRLDGADVVEKAAAEADVVVHTADSADNVAGAQAIARGLAAGHTAARPGHWIHTSGTAILTWYDAEHGRYGEAPLPSQRYDDVDGVGRLVDLPDAAPHRAVDKVVLAANSEAVRAAIVCPPTIYGPGRGAFNARTIQVPNLVRATLRRGAAPVVGAGAAEWDHVHVDDLGALFVALVDAARDPATRDAGDVFGPRAYFFAAAGAHVWGDVARWVADEARTQGWLPEARTEAVAAPEVELMPGGTLTWGLNSKGEARRAGRFLGWRPRGAALRDGIAELVASEAAALGLGKGGGKQG